MLKGQSSFEYTVLVVAVLVLVAVYAVAASKVIDVRQRMNETQALYSNYSGSMLSKPNCRVFFRKCGQGWGAGTSVAADSDEDGGLESYAYFMDTGVVRIRLLGYTKRGYPVYYAQTPSAGGLAQSIDLNSWTQSVGQAGAAVTGNGKTGAQAGVQQQMVSGIAVNANPSDSSGEYHFYTQEGGACPTDPFPVQQQEVDETCW